MGIKDNFQKNMKKATQGPLKMTFDKLRKKKSKIREDEDHPGKPVNKHIQIHHIVNGLKRNKKVKWRKLPQLLVPDNTQHHKYGLKTKKLETKK